MPRTNTIAKVPMFGVPSLEVSNRIDNSDKLAALTAAHFRCTSRLREMEAQFEAKANEIRQAYLNEAAEILNGSEEVEE